MSLPQLTIYNRCQLVSLISACHFSLSLCLPSIFPSRFFPLSFSPTSFLISLSPISPIPSTLFPSSHYLCLLPTFPLFLYFFLPHSPQIPSLSLFHYTRLLRSHLYFPTILHLNVSLELHTCWLWVYTVSIRPVVWWRLGRARFIEVIFFKVVHELHLDSVQYQWYLRFMLEEFDWSDCKIGI